MGSMLAMKVFIAKFWSFILVIVLKFSTAIVYFFSDYLWGSWIAPIIEVLIFTWLLEWMEKVPFLKKYLTKIYHFFITFFEWLEDLMENIFHIPVKRFLRFLTQRTKEYIYAFIGYEKVSAWKGLQEMRILRPNAHKVLVGKRENKNHAKNKTHISAREHLLTRRKVRK